MTSSLSLSSPSSPSSSLASSVACLRCKTVLIDDAVDGICFYQPSDSQLHLAIKQEKRLSIVDIDNNIDCNDGDNNDKIRTTMKRENVKNSPALLSSSKQRRKLISILCRNCNEKVGSEMPWGPEGTSFVALSHTKLLICGYAARSVREKLKSLVVPCIVEWKHIVFRNDDTFLRSNDDGTYGDGNACFQLLLPKSPLILPQVQNFGIYMPLGGMMTFINHKDTELTKHVNAFFAVQIHQSTSRDDQDVIFGII